MSKEPLSVGLVCQKSPTVYGTLHIYATTREWEEKKEQDKVEEVEEGGVCGKTTEFVLAKLHQTVSFTKHSLNPPR